MNLYLISQDKNDEYDTYDAAIVAAESADDAVTIHPFGTSFEESIKDINSGWSYDWVADIKDVKVEFIGTTNKSRGVILASFRAG